MINNYDLDLYVRPLWKGEKIINETVMFVGENDETSLLYDAKEILSVASYDLKTTYTEGLDYDYKDGKISRLPDGNIPYIKMSEYYPENKIEGKSFSCSNPLHKYIYFSEGATISLKQSVITYLHSDLWQGNLPKTQSDKFKKTLTKMRNKEDVTAVFYGDSITVGANSSAFIKCSPYVDKWSDMVVKKLEKVFGCRIRNINTAVGGKGSNWGAENINENVVQYDPDLVFLAFGMNDIGIEPREYGNLIEKMIIETRKENSHVEICLISPMLPNKEASFFFDRQEEYETELKKLSKKFENIALAPVTMMHQQILKRKRYYDMTGNNINHPNDFLSRVYAQTVLTSILGDY